MKSRTWWLGVVAAVAWLAVPAWANDDDSDEANDSAEFDESSASADGVFDFLVAELAAQRGDVDGAIAIYQRLARELHDPQVARRAVELAIRSRNFPLALESSTLLLELDPTSTLAREIVAALLANEGDLPKARETLTALLDKNPIAGRC